MRKYNFHKQNCNSSVRASVKFGNTIITLVGKHAFEWSIIKEESGKIIITTFPDREHALDEFNRFKRK